MAGKASRKVDLPGGLVARRERAEKAPTVLAIDPGGTTGWCVLSVDRGGFEPGEKLLPHVCYRATGHIYGAGLRDQRENEVVRDILELISHWPQAVVVMEDFIPMRPSREREYLSPVRIADKVEYALWEKDWPPLEWQMPSEMKGMPDDLLRSQGWYDADWIQAPHGRDALRHAMVRLKKAKMRAALAASYGWRAA